MLIPVSKEQGCNFFVNNFGFFVYYSIVMHIMSYDIYAEYKLFTVKLFMNVLFFSRHLFCCSIQVKRFSDS